MKCPKDGTECAVFKDDPMTQYFDFLKQIGRYGQGTGEY